MAQSLAAIGQWTPRRVADCSTFRRTGVSCAALFAPADYAFELPPELIAQEPAATRDASRLLHVGADTPTSRSRDLVELLPADAVVVVNDTRVIPARVLGQKPTGGAVELLFLEPSRPAPGTPLALPRARAPAAARRPDHPRRRRRGRDRERARGGWLDRRRAFPATGSRSSTRTATSRCRATSRAPDRRRADDRERYQTMFAREPGAVAAPTAGLHVTPAIVDALAARGIDARDGHAARRLGHVRADPRGRHPRSTTCTASATRSPTRTAALVATGRPVVALGTTALRALEAARARRRRRRDRAVHLSRLRPPFRTVDHLITNFHLPESTLLMLVCAFAGTERVLAAYRHAVAARYRFFATATRCWSTDARTDLPTPGFSFELLATLGHARAGILHTPRGDIATPVFMPVGTPARSRR